jgi:hypothetical protein
MGKNLTFSLQKINLHVFYTQINKKMKELFKVHQLSVEKHFFSHVTIVSLQVAQKFINGVRKSICRSW